MNRLFVDRCQCWWSGRWAEQVRLVEFESRPLEKRTKERKIHCISSQVARNKTFFWKQQERQWKWRLASEASFFSVRSRIAAFTFGLVWLEAKCQTQSRCNTLAVGTSTRGRWWLMIIHVVYVLKIISTACLERGSVPNVLGCSSLRALF